MTVQQIAARLLRYIGVNSFDPAVGDAAALGRPIMPGDVDDLVACINGALQELFEEGPSAIRETRGSGVLPAPTAVTFTATQYSTTIGSFTGYQTWMQGCTVQLSGDGYDNEIVNATTLLRPYVGGSATVSGTVYGDALLLSSTFQNVMDPVRVPNRSPLHPASSRQEFDYWNEPACYGSHWRHGIAYYTTRQKYAGVPFAWFCEAQYSGASDVLPVFLRVNPMPQGAMAITFRAKRKAPVIVAANIVGDDPTVDPGVTLPVELPESILLPFAQQRWTAHPAFVQTGSSIAEIARQYATAKRQLESLVPQISPADGHYH